MLHIARVAPIVEAPGEPADQTKATIHLTQQQTARIRGDVPAIETSHNRTPIYRFKFK
jgi:hypothetical protein